MAKQETGLARTARLLDLVPYLTTHQGIAITELAKTFNTTVKEITDDLNTLWMCGLPGYTPLELIDLEFESGFVSIRNAETLAAPRALDRAEALSIYMGLDLLNAELNSSSASLKSEIDNLQEQLRSQLISAPQVHIEASMKSEFRALILRAIRRRGWLEITYHSAANDQVTKRQVAPYELSQSSSNEAAIQYEVKIHEASRQVREVLPQVSGDSTDATLQGFSASWISRAILSLGGQVEVTGPTQIRAAVHARAKAALENYH